MAMLDQLLESLRAYAAQREGMSPPFVPMPPGVVDATDQGAEAETARALAAARLGKRRWPVLAEPVLAEPPLAANPAPDVRMAGILGSMGMGLPAGGGFQSPYDEANPAAAAEAAREAAARTVSRSARRAGPFTGAQNAAVPFAGMLSGAGLLGAPGGGDAAPAAGAVVAEAPPADLPPSTNDPDSHEPQVFADGVPLPRPRPISPASTGAVPLSMAAEPETSAIPPKAMLTGPAAAVDGAPASDGIGGILGKIFKPENAGLFMALGAGFSGAPSFGTGMRRAATAAGPAIQARQAFEEKRGNIAETYRALVAAGVPPAQAVSATRNSVLLKALVEKYIETPKLQTANGVVFRQGADGKVEKVADFSDDKTAPKLSDGFQWNDPADKTKGQTFIPGGSADPKVKAQSARLSNPPSYEWIDPNDHSKGQRAVEGGPATKVPAELAGKLALMEVAKKDMPEARRILMEGRGKTGTGISGFAASKTNIGDTGRAQRTVRTAIETALRVMTGAAAPEKEVDRYEVMFMPSPLDARETAKQKLDQLENFIANAERLAVQGRSSALPVSSAPAATPSLGIGKSTVIDGVTIKRLN